MIRLGAFLPVLFFAGHAAAAPLQPIELKDDRAARERPTAEALMSREISALPGARVETAMVDIDGNGVGEVLVRIIHAESCDRSRTYCRTTLFRHDGRDWRRILDAPVRTLALGDANPKGERALVIDGDEVRTIQAGTYRVEAKASGASKIRFTTPAPAKAKEIAGLWGPGAVRLLDAKADLKVLSGTADLDGRSGPQQVYRLEGSAACGLAGCPVRAVIQRDGRQGVVLEGFAKGDVWVMGSGRDGVRALVLESSVGNVAYAFDGRRYVADGPRR